MVEKRQDVFGFHTINIDGPFRVVLIQDSLDYIEFSGVEKQLKTCEASVSDSVLSIKGTNKGEYLHPNQPVTKVFVHLRNIRLINANDDCSLESEMLLGDEIGVVVGSRSFECVLNLDCRTFYFWNNPGGSNVTLSGNVEELKYWTVGLSSLDARYLIANYVLVSHGSQSDLKVAPQQKLEYSITNIGNLVYYGNPSEIDVIDASGIGSLIHGY